MGVCRVIAVLFGRDLGGRAGAVPLRRRAISIQRRARQTNGRAFLHRFHQRLTQYFQQAFGGEGLYEKVFHSQAGH